MTNNKKKSPAKSSTTKPAPKKARKVAISDLSEKDLKNTAGGGVDYIPVRSAN